MRFSARPIRARQLQPSRRVLATFEAAARSRFTRFYVASPIPLPAQPARRDGRMLSELAPVITTTLSLIPGMKFCFPAFCFRSSFGY
jgi:hypothetical protein